MNITAFSVRTNAAHVNPFIYYLKIKKMNYQPEELNNKTCWIMGTKTRQEDYFHIQVITEYKTYSSLFTKLNNQHEIDFYFMEIELPNKLKPETIPF